MPETCISDINNIGYIIGYNDGGGSRGFTRPMDEYLNAILTYRFVMHDPGFYPNDLRSTSFFVRSVKVM